MKQAPTLRPTELLFRLALGGLFIYAGVAKIFALPAIRDAMIAGQALLPLERFLALEDFFWDVHHFGLTPWDISMVLAMFLPWLEVVSGLALISSRLRAGALLIITALSAVFLGAIASAWWRGLDLTCGCFGKEVNATNYPQHLLLNGAMLAACLVLWWMTDGSGRKPA